jgi:hypothetical protein
MVRRGELSQTCYVCGPRPSWSASPNSSPAQVTIPSGSEQSVLDPREISIEAHELGAYRCARSRGGRRFVAMPSAPQAHHPDGPNGWACRADRR